MAPRKSAEKPAETPDVTPEPNPTPETPETPQDEWATLAAPVAMPDRKPFQGITVKVVETVPEGIRMRAEASLSVNAAAVAAKAGSTANRKRVEYHWDVQPVASTEQGNRFINLLTKYSKYRPSDGDIPHCGDKSPKGQVTARTGEPTYYVTKDDGEVVDCASTDTGAYLGVRYSVRPFEQRKSTAHLPGSE